MKHLFHSRWFDPILVLVWTLIGTALRLTHLTAKPPWTDEFATLVFSLGHSFETVPLDQVMPLSALLEPIRVSGQSGFSAVLHHLLTEDVHPPLYFGLAHLWLGLFPLDADGFVSLWAARSLPALLGAASIPALYGLGRFALQGGPEATVRSRLAGHFAALLMAVSPFGVYLAQEARHYTLGILWVIASLACLIAAVHATRQYRNLAIGTVLSWIVVNSLGVATHYFFLIGLAAEGLALLGIGLAQNGRRVQAWLQRPWPRVYAAAGGTLVGCAVWLPIWQALRSREVTQWIQSDEPYSFLSLINPIFQSLAGWITMLVLLPVESSSIAVVVVSGLLMVLFLFWSVPIFWRGFWLQWRHPQTRLVLQAMGSFVLSAIAIFFLITYGLGADLTRGARYNFVYFPGVILLLAISLVPCWQQDGTVSPHTPSIPSKPANLASRLRQLARRQGKQAVLLIAIVGLLSGLTVVNNLGYRKYYRPDLLIPLMQQTSQHPAVIATTQATLVQIGEMMGLGWEARSLPEDIRPQFLLAHEQSLPCESNCLATQTLQTLVAEQPRPFDLWLVNFQAPTGRLEAQGCAAASTPEQLIYGYEYELYRCGEGER